MKRLLAMAIIAIVLTTAVSLWAYLSGSRTLHAEARELNTAIAASSVGNELAGNGANANGSASPRGRAQALVDGAHTWAKKITLATTATGLGLTGVILGAAAFWQRRIGTNGGANSTSPTAARGRTPSPTLKTTTALGPKTNSGPHATAGVTPEALVQQLRFELSTHVKERRKAEAELTDLKTQFNKRLEERTAGVSAELNQRKQAEKTLSQQRQELERSKDVLELHVQARTQQLQTLQRRYEHILNSAGEGIYGLDMQGKTTFVNPAAAKLTGYTVEELLGKPERHTILRHARETSDGARPLSARAEAHIGPDTPIITSDTDSLDRPLTTTGTQLVGRAPHLRDPVIGAHNNPTTNGQSDTATFTATAPDSGEQTFYRKDGTPVLVEYTRTPIIENGKQMGAVVTFKDITERKRAEQTLAHKAAELTRSNAELEQFAYVASHDLQEPLRKIRAFGDRLKTTIDQLTSQNPESRIQNSEAARSDTGHTQTRRRKKTSETTAHLDRASAAATDTQITARADAPAVAPALVGSASALPPAVASARDYLERMQNAAARMQTLINDLLTFSRVISTTQPFIPVDLAAITREVLGDLELRIQQTGAKIHIGHLPAIDADPMQMRQLLQNIIANALKFQPSGPRTGGPEVRITAQTIDQPFGPSASAQNSGRHASAVELSIQDNGIGFDPKYTDKIFAMFQRLHGRSEYEGTGVGLAVCRRITDRHSGTITATSEPGKGSTFIIRLPVQQTNKTDQPAP